eukprot:3723974-Pleurochrysis_carterae.AAC.2
MTLAKRSRAHFLPQPAIPVLSLGSFRCSCVVCARKLAVDYRSLHQVSRPLFVVPLISLS